MNPYADVVEETKRIIEQASQRGMTIRLLGGLAVKFHCPSAEHRALERHYPDIDFMITRVYSKEIPKLMAYLGYEPNEKFNILNGEFRMLFYDQTNNRQIDIFMQDFHMCHTIPISRRLKVEEITVPLAELLLTKLQIVQLNEKDLLDIMALLLDHPLGEGDAETINSKVITDLTSQDWGLYKTVCLSLQKTIDFVDTRDMKGEEKKIIRSRAQELQRAIEQAPKSVKWKLRAAIGEKIQWYDLPEEVARG
ncbi:hypothetical protein HKBW3S43_00257 [Candidatus Hakubella thermalkaliphila]|uniref:Nucleotidyltransferase family protein n=1 Tax=Candidatus Hakubella thermalkaliphila TaxID=2754717 RepID=A0A6V8P5U2_9ACTN|nr:hypothetical protein [Candidatus Hakubella thermalkaliphila]GFP28002.1 hypothetical protein HKBW3S33_01419 [Candidatus Hakubella thermalkaliphila]GFP34464.1 hypothetical protein HKBW3S43_00257 [Candidatus Hakubella thermalkaliphila]